jgi:predicted aspartyl protease
MNTKLAMTFVASLVFSGLTSPVAHTEPIPGEAGANDPDAVALAVPADGSDPTYCTDLACDSLEGWQKDMQEFCTTGTKAQCDSLKADVARINQYILNLTKQEARREMAVEVPLFHRGRSHSLTAAINGYVTEFLLDTGAEGTCLTQQAYSNRVAAGALTPADTLPQPAIVIDANGGQRVMPRVMINDFTLGNYILHNVVVTVGCSEDSLLGQEVLRRFGSYKIDNQRNVLVLN